MTPALSVYAAGMVTAVGFNAQATCAAMRGGISGLQQDNLWDRRGGEYATVGRVRLRQWWEGPGMLANLVAPAIEECLERTARHPRWSRLAPEQIPIVVTVAPPHRPLRPPDLEQVVAADLGHVLGRALPPGSVVFGGGRTGIAHALSYCNDLVRSRRAAGCVIAGVESFLTQPQADHYIHHDRMMHAENSSGFFAGEAGCAVFVGPAGLGDELAIVGLGRGHEASRAGGDATHPVNGAGLTRAMSEALERASLQFAQLSHRIGDLNGEHFKFKEATMATTRLHRLPPAGTPPTRYGYIDVWHPIEYLGEIGSAIFPCMLGVALEASRRGYAPGPRWLHHGGEDDGERVAIVTVYQGLS